jgi:hypothetical protein
LFFVVAAGLLVSVWLLPKVVRFFRGVVRSIRGFLRPAATT